MSRLVPAGADARRQVVKVEVLEEGWEAEYAPCHHKETWRVTQPEVGAEHTCPQCLGKEGPFTGGARKTPS